MPNIKFNYLYRDGSNYEQFAFIIFENPNHIVVDAVQTLIQTKLIDKQYIYAADWQLPDLHFNSWDKQTDHTFHEFESVEYTNESANTLLTLAGFVTLIKKTNWVY